MSQIFKIHVPTNILYNLLKNICEKEDFYKITKYHFIKNLSFINNFENSIFPYLSNPIKIHSFKKFIQLIRKICFINHIPFFFKINYIKNSYEIHYYVKDIYSVK